MGSFGPNLDERACPTKINIGLPLLQNVSPNFNLRSTYCPQCPEETRSPPETTVQRDTKSEPREARPGLLANSHRNLLGFFTIKYNWQKAF